MSDWLDETFYLPAQTEIDRAVNYPYDAPDTAFILIMAAFGPLMMPRFSMTERRFCLLDQTAHQCSSVANLVMPQSFPLPLLSCMIATSSAWRSSAITGGAVYRFSGCRVRVRLNVAWLDGAQLEIMHRTEAVGIAYDYIRFNGGAVTHLPVPAAGGEIISGYQPVFGYAARGGVLDIGGSGRIVADFGKEPNFPDNEPGRGRQICTPAHGP